jgi:hypothetical protein
MEGFPSDQTRADTYQTWKHYRETYLKMTHLSCSPVQRTDLSSKQHDLIHIGKSRK